jgi:hypothetical protein
MVGVGVFGHTASLRDDGATHARRETPSVRRERAHRDGGDERVRDATRGEHE